LDGVEDDCVDLESSEYALSISSDDLNWIEIMGVFFWGYVFAFARVLVGLDNSMLLTFFLSSKRPNSG
jgi:hypothetical protein